MSLEDRVRSTIDEHVRGAAADAEAWNRLQQRLNESPTAPPPTRRSSRIVTAVVAFAVFIAGAVFAWQAFRPAPVSEQAPGDGVAGIALWPERTAADLAQTQALADSGDPSVAWRLDPKDVATRFAEQVLGWGEPATSGAVSYRVTVGTTPETGNATAALDRIAIPCPSPPPGEVGTCPPPYDNETLTLRQLGATGPAGVWTVTSVSASGLTLDLEPGETLGNDTQLNGSVTFPNTWQSVEGFHAEAGFHVGTGNGCDQTQANAAQQGGGSVMVVAVDPSACDEATPAGYAWFATGTPMTLLSTSTFDPLKDGGDLPSPRVYGLTVTPFTLSLEQPTGSPTTGSLSALVSEKWQATSIAPSNGAEVPIDPSRPPTLTFSDPQTINGTTGCNPIRYDWFVGAGGTIWLTPVHLPIIQIACENPLQQRQETAFLAIMRSVDRYEASPSRFTLTGPAGSIDFTNATNLATPGSSAPPGASSRSPVDSGSASAQFARCNLGELRLGLGQVSEATGQNSRMLSFTNVAATPCSLFGYPGIEVLDAAGQSLPLVYRQTGDQMVTSRPPATVIVAPGGVAYAMINKYRCDAGDQQIGRTLVVSLPGGTHTLVARIGRSPGFSYCGQGDPGSVVSISPFEPTASSTSAH